MTSDNVKPFFDVSSAKEPPRSLNLDKEAAAIEAEEASEQSDKDLNLDDLVHEENSKNLGEDQMITAHIPGGGIIPSENQ